MDVKIKGLGLGFYGLKLGFEIRSLGLRVWD